MRLIVKRTHEQINGTWYFIHEARLQLTADEEALLAQYGLGDVVLLPGDRSGVYGPTTVGNQMAGTKRLNRTLPETMGYERSLQDACSQLPGMLNYCRSFNADEVIDIQG